MLAFMKITLLSFFLFFTFASFGESHKNKCKNFLSIASVFKDEAPYLREWIEYHKLLGVEHFYLYNNDSNDNFLEVLTPYVESGEVTLTDWPSDPQQLGLHQWVWKTQWPALSDAIRKARGISTWLALIDIDEFILPLKNKNIPDFLSRYKKYAGIAINWQCFGTSNIEEIPHGKLLIESLTYKSTPKHKLNCPVKSIVKPHHVDLTQPGWTPHTWCISHGKNQFIFSNYKPFDSGKIILDKIVINHYVHRTEGYFRKDKLAKKERMDGKGRTDAEIKEWHDACNAIEDKSIFIHVPALRKIIFGS